jgi:hypothetical protein
MNLLSLIPLPYRLVLLSALAAAAFGSGAVWVHRDRAQHVAIGVAQEKALFDAYVAQVQQQAIAARDAAIKAQQAAEAETERRISDQQEASRVHEKQLDQARADAAATTAAVQRLQHRIAQLAAASRSGSAPSGNPAAASVSTPAERVGIVASESAAEYAALAEAARRGYLAGRECEADYQALKK